jgi:hypothetical protein
VGFCFSGTPQNGFARRLKAVEEHIVKLMEAAKKLKREDFE